MKIDAKQRDVVKQLKLDIKRTNTRITAVAKRYGINSPVYKETIKGFENSELAKYTHKTDKGVLQISASLGSQYSKTNKPSKLPQRYLLRSQLSKVSTLTGIERRYEEQSGLTEEQLAQMTPEQKIKNIESMYKIRDKFEAAKSQFYELFTTGFQDGGEQEQLMKDMFTSGKKSYEDLQKFTEQMEFFSEYAENYNPMTKEFEFSSNDRISPDDIPDFVKYIFID